MLFKKLFTMQLICTTLVVGIPALTSAHQKQEPIKYGADDVSDKHSHKSHPFPPVSAEQAAVTDNRIIAKKYQWGLKETQQHMLNQDKFGDLIFDLQSNHSDVFASSAMASKPGANASVWIKGKADSKIRERVKRFMEKSELKIELIDGMRFSVKEQEKRMDAISELLQGQGIKGIGAAMLPGDVLLVSMPASDRFPETPRPENFERTKPHGNHVDPASKVLLFDKLDPRGIYFTFTKQPIDVDLHVRGGRQVSGSSGICTSGFSVERISDLTSGVATAAHCTGVNTYDAESPEADFTLSHRGEHCSTHGDLEWKSSSHFELAEYWASPIERRNVNSRENSYSVNNTYCVYSRMTGTRSCDQVYSTSVSQSSSSPGICNGGTAQRLVAMDDNSAIPGDSGGPWSLWTEAAGIVKGTKWIWFGTRSTFSKTSRLDEALGVRVKTQ